MLDSINQIKIDLVQSRDRVIQPIEPLITTAQQCGVMRLQSTHYKYSSSSISHLLYYRTLGRWIWILGAKEAILPYPRIEQLMHIERRSCWNLIPPTVVQNDQPLRLPPKLSPRVVLLWSVQWLVARAVTNRPKTKNGCALACIVHNIKKDGGTDQISVGFFLLLAVLEWEGIGGRKRMGREPTEAHLVFDIILHRVLQEVLELLQEIED